MDLLRKPSALRSALIGFASTGVLLLITQFALPGTAGPGRGTPTAILFQGLVLGSLTAMSSIGVVLIYRTSRIVNFANAALGAVGAVLAYNLIVVYEVPYGLAFAAGVIGSGLVALAAELLILRRFFEAPRLVFTIVTIGLGGLLGTYGVGAVAQLPIWGETRSLAEQFGRTTIVPARSIRFTIGDVLLPFTLGHILALVALVVAMAGIGVFLKYTKLGIAIRASSENAERAELLGVNVRILQTVVWVIAGGLSAAAITLFGTISPSGFAVGAGGAGAVLIASLAAAVVARMRSITIAAVASIFITVLQSAFAWSFRDGGTLIEAALFVVILLGLLVQRRTLQRAQEASSWAANEEVRPTPRELLAIPTVRTWRRILMGAAGLFVLVYPWTVESGLTNRASFAAIYAMVLLSLVVLTGWAGQVSLGQFGFVAIAALTGAALTSRAGWSFWLALPIGATIAALAAILVGLPALRIRGLFLAVVTLAFASAASLVLFDDRYFGWLEPRDIRRPTLLFVDFEDERSMYYLALLFLGLTIALVTTLRRTRPGRVLIALRESESDLQAFGINVVRTKLAAFALSGFICGVAGVLFAHHQRAVGQAAFVGQASLEVFIFAVIGGLGSVSGAMLGSALGTVINLFPINDATLQFFINAQFGLLFILYLAPSGLAGMVFGIRDSILRIIATRNQLVVPSLMADVDPSVVARQLIPLGEAQSDAGLGALAAEDSYRLRSDLYTTERAEDDGRRAPDDRAALSAAAQSAAAEE